MRFRLLLLALLSAPAAACDGITGSADDNFSFTSMAVAYDTGMVDQADVVTQVRNLQIDGLFILPHPCFELRGDYRRTGGEITFTASAYPTNQQCPAVVSAVQYRVNTFGADRGTYRARIYHNIVGTAPRLITDATVTVN